MRIRILRESREESRYFHGNIFIRLITQLFTTESRYLLPVKSWVMLRSRAKCANGKQTNKEEGLIKMKRKTQKKRRRKSRKPFVRRTKEMIFPKKPTTARQYFSMLPEDQEIWDSVAHVISRMRDRVSLPKASKEFGIGPNVVVRLGSSALRKRNGRYVATKTDTLLRVLKILGAGGKKEIATRDSRQASLVGGHWAAVQRYLQTGDDSALQRFKNKKITDANGKRHLLLTDLKELDRQASPGVLRFESIYAAGVR